MIERTCSQRDAASVIFYLPDCHVIDAIDLPLGGRRVVVRADTFEGGCPDCGVVSSRVHAWCRQRVKDVPHAGHLELVVVKPRLVCVEAACPRRTFTPTTTELPRRARCTSRLRADVLTAVIDHGRPVDQVAQHRFRLRSSRSRLPAAWAARTVFRATPTCRAICLIAFPSDLCNRRISAQ